VGFPLHGRLNRFLCLARPVESNIKNLAEMADGKTRPRICIRAVTLEIFL
jgi:hypothetical protein